MKEHGLAESLCMGRLSPLRDVQPLSSSEMKFTFLPLKSSASIHLPSFSQVHHTIPNLQKVCKFSSRRLASLVGKGCVWPLTYFLYLLVTRLCPCWFSLWEFSISFCCYYEIDLSSLRFFLQSFKHIFVIPIIKNSFLDHQLLPKHEPIPSLVFLAISMRMELNPLFLQTHNNSSTSPAPWISELVTAHKQQSEIYLKTSYHTNQKAFHQPRFYLIQLLIWGFNWS